MGAAVVAIWLLTLAFPFIADAIIAIRYYPQLRFSAAETTNERNDLRESLDKQVNEVLPAEIEAAFLKGRDSILGSLLAEASRAEIIVAAVSVQDGGLQLFAPRN